MPFSLDAAVNLNPEPFETYPQNHPKVLNPSSAEAQHPQRPKSAQETPRASAQAMAHPWIAGKFGKLGPRIRGFKKA